MVDNDVRKEKLQSIKNFLFMCSLNPTITNRFKAKVISPIRVDEVENILFICSLDPTITLLTIAKMIYIQIYNKDDKEISSGDYNTEIVL